MTEPLRCWRCGASLDAVPLPLGREAECNHCRAQLYVCRMCLNYDPRRFGGCLEERAEPPLEKDRANFCDWFSPDPAAFQGRNQGAQTAARAQLDALFGGSAPEPEAKPGSALDELFKK